MLDRDTSTVSSHVRLLRDLGFLELTRTEHRRGAVAHFYRATRLALIEEEEWEAMPTTLRRGLVAQTFCRLFREGAESGGNGGFDGRDARLQRYPLARDAEGWREVTELVDQLVREVEEVQGRSDGRRRDGAAAPVRQSVLGVLHFARSDGVP